MSEWISLKDRFPLYKQCILLWLDDLKITAEAVYRGEYEKGIHVFRLDLNREDIEYPIENRISYWMPLPNPPESTE